MLSADLLIDGAKIFVMRVRKIGRVGPHTKWVNGNVGSFPTVGSTDQVVITKATANIACRTGCACEVSSWLCGRALTLSNYPHTSFDCSLPLCRASQEDASPVSCITKITISTAGRTCPLKRHKDYFAIHDRGGSRAARIR